MTPVLAEVEKNTKNVTGRRRSGFPPGADQPLAGSPISLSLAFLSGFLLTLAFPRWNLWPLAWVALIPLFYALDRAQNKFQAFLLSFLAGFSFFLLSVSWLRHVTTFGMFFVVTMEAAYWGMFGMIYYALNIGAGPRACPETGRNTNSNKGQPQGVAPTFVLSAIWTALEFIRSEIPVWGMGWNLLGSSQAPNLWVAQLASVGGVYAVSFLVFLGNLALYSFFKKGIRKGFQTLAIFGLLFVAVLLFGWNRFLAFSPVSFFRVSVLQGNIPQLLKWDESHKEEILKIYLNLTELASYDAPQLIVWPEAAYPGFFNREPLADRVKELVKRIETPVLVGSPHQETDDTFYNSAYLLNPSGEIENRYDKIRLVPFGEYVPLKSVLGFLESLAYELGVSDFSEGKRFTVFNLKDSGIRFASLICFEDSFPGLAREFMKRGVDFLVVITNDAWFDRSSAPYQHLQASVFRAIENGVSVVRAANTGVSAFITPLGEIAERVHNQEGKDIFIMGGMTYPVVLTKENTLYQHGGWLFPYLCLFVLVLTFLFSARLPKKSLAFFAVLLIFSFTGCIRLQGGAFYAKKGPQDEVPKVKEAYFDSNELLPGKKQAPGKIEV